MGASDLVLSALRSRTVRTTVAGATGIRTISGTAPQGESGGGFFGFVKNFGGAVVHFGGWIIGQIGAGLQFSFTAVWGLFVQTATFIYNFDWNQPDASLDSYIQNMYSILASQLGGTIGNAIGYLVCGVVPAAAIATFNEPLGLYLLEKVGEEAVDEFLGNFALLIRQSIKTSAQVFLISTYKNTRRAIKDYLKDPNSPQSRFFSNIFGSNFNNAVKTWGDGKKSWSFRQAVDDSIESIKNPVLENFVEELVEEALDACVEAGYVIAGGLDTWVAEQKLQKNLLLGQQRILEIQPDRSIDSEKIVLAGNEHLIKSSLPAVLANYQTIEARDVGMWVGEPVTDKIKTAVSPLSLKIFFRGIKTPPWRESKRTQIEIPNLDRTKIDWENIKLWAGGANGYLWGRFQAQATLSGGYHMYVWGGTADEASDRLKALLALSESTLESLIVHEEVKEAKRLTYRALQKETSIVYPAYFTIFNQQRVLNEESGYAALSGIYKRKNARIDLWTNTKPDDFQSVITELLRVPGTNSP